LAAEELLRQAEAKYEAALRIKPDDHEALNNWGNALAARARRASDASAAEELLRQAEAKYEAALRIKPDDHAALHSFGSFSLARAKRTSGRVQKDLLRAAEAKLKAAKKLGDTDTYNLACVYALLGRPLDCRRTLDAAKKAGTLPTVDHLRSDEDLKSVRSEAWFGELIERLSTTST
jgi:tetratricopeptide (TPR) repeat protein